MMSAEYPEIIPEPFNYPCASYSGNAEDFCIKDVVEKCHSPYNGLSFPDPPCPSLFASESKRHILIQELAVRQDHHLLPNSSERDQGRSSYSCEPNVLIVMKEPLEILGKPLSGEASTKTRQETCSPITADRAGDGDGDVSGGNSNIQVLAQDLSTKRNLAVSPLFNASTTSTNCASWLCLPTVEQPEEEKMAGCVIRGSEVAKLEGGSNTAEFSDAGSKNQIETAVHESVSAALLAPPSNRRRMGSTLLQHVPAAHRNLHPPALETRKLSDSALCMRKDRSKRTMYEQTKQRCHSDTHAPSYSFPLDEDERESSALGCDSGFQDDKGSRFHISSPRVSVQSLDLLSQDEGSETHSRGRRVTPYLPYSLLSQDGSQSDDMSSVYQSSCSGNPGTMVHPRERSRRSLMKHYSQGSISGMSISGASVGGASIGGSSIGASSDSPSLSSILDCQSNVTGVTDLLSSLGFDDFDSPQLVPDRFIPKDLEYLKPSFMKTALIEQNLSPDPPRSPDSLASGQYSNSTHYKEFQQQPSQPLTAVIEPADLPLPLGATAENFLDYKARPGSPVPKNTTCDSPPEKEEPTTIPKELATTPLFTDTMHFVDLSHSRILETVPEETASDLSPSPRWFSPRVSIDHSVHMEFSDRNLGANLNIQKVRKRSLPTNREGYRWSIGSLVESDTGDSIHLSVTSYDDMIAAEREKERENLPQLACDDTLVGGVTRRRRKGVYNPPQTLLSWLSTQKTINEEEDTDPDELPWPFNEQARLRKSLTEISLAQKNALAESVDEDHCGRHTSNSMSSSQRDMMSLSPISTPNRSSPQPTLSEDEDEDQRQPSNLLGPRRGHRDGHLRVSSPFSYSMEFPIVSSSYPSLDSFNQDQEEGSPSTVSLLHTEQGSLTVLPSEDSFVENSNNLCTNSLQKEDIVPPFSILPSNLQDVQVDNLSQDSHDPSNSSTFSPLTPVSTKKAESFTTDVSEDTENQDLASFKFDGNFESKDSRDVFKQISDDVHFDQKDGVLDDLPASHICAITSVQSSAASRRLRYAERKQQSSESLSQELPSPNCKSSTSRVRRKAVFGDAPPSPLKFFGVTKEQTEVEKFMVL